MPDLKRHLAPLEDLEMPDRWESIRRRPPRSGVQVEAPRRQRAAVIALAAALTLGTVVWISQGFDRSEAPVVVDTPSPTVSDTPSPSPEPSPEPEPTPTLDPKAIVVGLDFGICDVTEARGELTPGGAGTAWFGTRTDDDTLQCRRESRDYVLAVDIGGDGLVERWIEPIGEQTCFTSCGLEGVSDVDGDGTDELVLLLEGGSVSLFGVVDVGEAGKLTQVGYVDGGAPSGFPDDGFAGLAIGGDEGYAYAVTCESTPDGPVIIQRSRSSIIDQPDAGTTVRTTRLRMTSDGFVVLGDDIQEGVQDPPLLPSDSRLCDLDLRGYGEL